MAFFRESDKVQEDGGPHKGGQGNPLKKDFSKQIVGHLNGKPIRATKNGAVPAVVTDEMKHPGKKGSPKIRLAVCKEGPN